MTVGTLERGGAFLTAAQWTSECQPKQAVAVARGPLPGHQSQAEVALAAGALTSSWLLS